jgi:hypothetical protein
MIFGFPIKKEINEILVQTENDTFIVNPNFEDFVLDWARKNSILASEV